MTIYLYISWYLLIGTLLTLVSRKDINSAYDDFRKKGTDIENDLAEYYNVKLILSVFCVVLWPILVFHLLKQIVIYVAYWIHDLWYMANNISAMKRLWRMKKYQKLNKKKP